MWRIEKMQPVKIDKVNGKFFVGDSYILLSTSKATPTSTALSWSIHFWLGSETSQDEAGVAAYKSVELDDALGGRAKQYREVQGSESSLFLSYFKSGGGIQYAPGGVESGFHHVESDVYVTKLLQLKGRRTVCVKEVPLSSASLNKGDVFILDAGLKIFVFNGPAANKFEKTKGIEVATAIRDDQRSGKAHIVFLDDDVRNNEFWGPLGGFVDPASLSAGEDDGAAELAQPKLSSALFVISDASGAVQFSEVPLPDGKLHRSMLKSDEVCVVIGAKTRKVFAWVGHHASLAEKREAMSAAMRFSKERGLPASTQIERLAEGVESSQFKSEFLQWDGPVSFGMKPSQGIAAKAADAKIDVNELLFQKHKDEQPVDDGSGQLQIWVINNFQKVELPKHLYGQFHTGDSYILLYTYLNSFKATCYMLYFWLGRDSSPDEKGSAALLAKELDDSLGGKPVQVRVVEGKEPTHFRQLFKGRMIVHSGGAASGFKNKGDADSYDTDGTALYHIRGTSSLNTVAVQVPEVAASLNSQDCFVLVTPTDVYTWVGVGSVPEEVTVSENIAAILAKPTGKPITYITEGDHEAMAPFWKALGGQGEYPSESTGLATHAPRDARLFQASTASGGFRVEEVHNFDQTDLNEEDVFILDTYTQLFVWVGSAASREEKDKALGVAEKFATEADDGRDHEACSIVQVGAGTEPLLFTAHFTKWDPEHFSKSGFRDPYEEKLRSVREKSAGSSIPVPPLKSTPSKAAPATAAKATAAASVPATEPAAAAPIPPVSGQFPYEDLKKGVPAGVDPSRKEEYLSKAEFLKIFEMDIAAFNAMPKWKKDQKKKAVGLF